VRKFIESDQASLEGGKYSPSAETGVEVKKDIDQRVRHNRS